MAYSLDSITADCYEGTTCLINKLGIRDEAKLAEVEAAIVLAKASYIDLHPIPGRFDLSHLCAIHQYLFSDLYDWAGKLRTVNISKKSTSFLSADEIPRASDACFARIHSIDFSSLSWDEFVSEVADFYSTLNTIHPFREGNGRAQRSFFNHWLRSMNYEIDFSSIDQDLFMLATIRAAHGISDYLIDLFDQHIAQREEQDMQIPGMDFELRM